MRIAGRFTGPPASANGGIAAGRLAAYLAGPVAQVTLRRPVPVDTDLRVDAAEGMVRLYAQDLLVAEAVPGSVDVAPIEAVTVDAARAASASYRGFADDTYGGCYVCGTARPDGLQVFPGPLRPDVVAGTWMPADDDPATLWGALDCPGGWAAGMVDPLVVLGRMTLRRDGEITPGTPHVVQGWVTGRAGRKISTATALYDAGGAVQAVAQQTWIMVEPDQLAR